MRSKNILPSAIILIAVFIFGCSGTRHVKADPPVTAESAKSMIDAQSFVFIPRYVHPISGRVRNLDFGFQVSVSKDTVVSYMPFMGRGYTAPLSPDDVDFDFTSTKFKTVVSNAKNGWIVSIKPEDRRNAAELYFRIFDNASASLNITSNDRSAISYDGYITERKLDKKK